MGLAKDGNISQKHRMKDSGQHQIVHRTKRLPAHVVKFDVRDQTARLFHYYVSSQNIQLLCSDRCN